MGGRMMANLAGLAEDHAVAIDLIDLNIRALLADRPECPGPAEVDEWATLTRAMRRHNSAVVMFLIRIIADLAVDADLDHRVLIPMLRGMATTRMDAAERAMTELGYTA